MNVYPVVLSGGVGSRLWPASRRDHPKQLHALTSEHSMLQETVARVRGETRSSDLAFADPLIVCNERHVEEIRAQLDRQGVTPHSVIAEPVGRNTAPAVALAAIVIAEHDPDGVALILPADHHITDEAAFHQAITRAAKLAREGFVVTYGIVPSHAETGYGYIARGQAVASVEAGYEVSRFVEKPDKATAERYVAEGAYYWNGGIFTARADTLLQEMERHCPDILRACRAALAEADRSNTAIKPARAIFADCPADSIDYAVMERTDRAAVVPVDMGWNDVGSWAAIYDVADKDGQANAVSGDVVLHDAHRCLVRAKSRLVAVAGLEDVVVIETEDAVLVTTREKAQSVKSIVEQLKAAKRSEL